MNLDTLRRWINDRWLEYGELYRLVRACEVDLNEGSFESMLNQVVASGALLHWHYSEAIDLHLPFGREDLAGAGGAEIFTWVRENQLGQRLSVDTWTEPLPPPSFAPAPSVSCSSSYGVVLNILELKDWRLVLIQLMLSRLATNRGG